ncbi:alpha-mannosidase 2-like, partial [Camellia sinensis]|uniref:alpha-mannosidase 2-like n=1 Tax=Camellia sinensis TaxID=4442 RepID=UPI0010358676
MSYLERWWKDASETKKESFINLVKNAQLEIVGGGWVMNDEANSHYFAIIEQMEELMKNQMFATHAVAAAGSVTLGTA